MKINFNKLLVIFFLLLGVKESAFAQTPPAVSVPSACPNQTVTASISWANVSSPTYSLFTPPNPPPASAPSQVFSSGSFPIWAPAATNFTIVASGTYLGNPITQTITFSLNVIAPPPMVLATSPDYCYGSTIVITAPPGGTTYFYSGVNISGTQSSGPNVINIPNATQGGQITVTTAVSGCTMTGAVTIGVAPLKVLSINSTSNICSGSSVNLTSNLPGGSGYQWYFSNNPLSYPNNIPATNAPNVATPTLNINNAGVYKVEVFDIFNTISCPYSGTTQINVVQTNPVNLTASPAKTVCQGSSLNLSANATGASSTGWTWMGPGFSSGSANAVINPAVPANSGIYSVTATFQGQFIVCNTYATIQVSVVPVSVPVITMPSSVCQNTTFVISGSAAGANINNFTWSGPAFPGGVITGTDAVTINTVQTNASGTQYLTVKFISGTIQCPVTTSTQLNVVTVNSVSVIPPPPVCSPNNAFLQALATGAYQYSWTGPLGFSNSGPNVYVYYPTPSATGVYSVTAFFGNGNLICSSSNTLQVTVTPALNFTLVPFQRVCYNDPVFVAGPPGATSYSWTSSTGYSSGDQDLNLTGVQSNATGTYTLNVSLGGCKTSAFTEVSVLTPITYTLKPYDRTICKGDTIYLEAGVTGGSENYAYTWSPDIYLESRTGPKQMAIPLGTVLYNLTVHDIACPFRMITHPVNITVNQAPTPKLQLDRVDGCAPFCLTYDIGKDVRDTSFITTFDFGKGDELTFQSDSVFTKCLTIPGTYNLKIYSKGKNGCTGTYEYPSPLIVYPGTGIDVSWTPEIPTTVDDITFYPNTSYPSITSYSWSFSGGVTQGDTLSPTGPGDSDYTSEKSPTRIYNQLGLYPVVLIAENDKGCIDTIVKYMNVIDDLQIFVPNTFTPNGDGVNDVFMPKGMGLKPENYVLDIFSRAGINVFTTKDINEGWDGKVGGQIGKDATYIYKIKVVGMNGEGRKELTGYVTIIK